MIRFVDVNTYASSLGKSTSVLVCSVGIVCPFSGEDVELFNLTGEIS